MMSERVTITLKKGFLREIDRLVDRVKIRSRSHLIELAMREYLDRKTAVQPDPLERWLGTIVDGRPSDALKEHDLVA
jgi:metal-responsive CopG/Arc/MetJ family transcriptional regulator